MIKLYLEMLVIYQIFETARLPSYKTQLTRYTATTTKPYTTKWGRLHESDDTVFKKNYVLFQLINL